MGLTGEICLVESIEKNPYKLLSFRNIFLYEREFIKSIYV